MFNKSFNTLSPLFDDEHDTLRSITSSSASSSSSSSSLSPSTLALHNLQLNSTFSSSSNNSLKQLAHPSILHATTSSSAPLQFKSTDLAPPSLLSSSSSSSKALSFPSFSTSQPSSSSTIPASSSSSIPLSVALAALPCPPAHIEFSSTLQLPSSTEQQWSVCWKAVAQFVSQLEFATQVVPSRHRTNKLKCSSSNVSFCIYFYCLPSSTTLLIEFQRRSGCCILFHHILKRIFDSLSTLLPALKMHAPNQQLPARQHLSAPSSLSSSSSSSYSSLLLPLSSSVSASSSSSVYQTSTPLYFQLLSQQPHLNMSTSSPSLAVSS